jgi:hypothetical protein
LKNKKATAFYSFNHANMTEEEMAEKPAEPIVDEPTIEPIADEQIMVGTTDPI